MLDRQKLETVLARRFPGSSASQIAAAANAIMGLGDEWEEIAVADPFGSNASVDSLDIFALAREAKMGAQLRVLRRRPV